MTDAIVFDCEFLTADGAPSRFWCGPADPDPVVAQIGVVRLGLEGDYPILERLRLHVIPLDRAGARVPLDPLFTRLTGITEAVLDAEGLPLSRALDAVRAFAGAARLWSWGKDEFNMVAIGCYVQGLAPPIPAACFANATTLLLKAGMPLAEIHRTPSNRLAARFGIPTGDLRGHDALDDALSVARTLQHLLRQGALAPVDLA